MSGSARPSLRRVGRDIRPHWRVLGLGAMATLFATGATAVGPLLIGHAIDHGVVDRQLSPVLWASVAHAVVVSVQIAATWSEARCYGRFAQDLLRAIRVRLVDHLYRLDLDFFSRERSGRLVARLTSDVENLQQFAETGLSMFVRAALLISVITAVMVTQSPLLAAVVALSLLPLVAATAWYRHHPFPAQVAVRDSMASLYGQANESLAGFRVVQAYGLEDDHADQFLRANSDGLSAKMRTVRLSAAYTPAVEFVQPAAIAAVFFVGALLVADGQLTVGGVVAFTLYLTRLFDPITQITELTHLFQTASAAYAKVLDFEDERPLVDDRPDAVALPTGPGRVRLENVSFRYGADRAMAVAEVDLELVPGERVVLVGRSGAGKSTVAKLVARFYDPASGRVLEDGTDVRDVTGSSLRRAVALVPQEGFLFDGTVADNIAAACPGTTREELEEACEALGIEPRLAALPDGLDTVVTNRGLSLSSGQRQMIALARVRVADPRIIILDEATSNLDPATEETVERGLGELFQGRTAVLIAHRPTTVWRADRVIVMEAGRVVEQGAPDDLCGRGGAFDRWLSSMREAAS